MTGPIVRITKRELRSSRAAVAIIAAIVVAFLAVYCLLEAMLSLLGQPAWLVDPLTAARGLSELPAGISPALLAVIGALIFFLGAGFFLNGLLAGRRARHLIEDPRIGVVVDDEVVASALARKARMAAGVTREQVMVVVSARNAQVNVRPTSGITLDEASIQAEVEAEVSAMRLNPTLAVTVNLATTGVVGV